MKETDTLRLFRLLIREKGKIFRKNRKFREKTQK